MVCKVILKRFRKAENSGWGTCVTRAKNRAQDYNGKNCTTLTAVAIANYKGQNALLCIHQTFLQLTTPINCQLKGLVTSAQILISHDLPSQTLFTMQSISQSCAADNTWVCSETFFFWQCRMSEKAIKAPLFSLLSGSRQTRDNTVSVVTTGYWALLYLHAWATVISRGHLYVLRLLQLHSNQRGLSDRKIPKAESGPLGLCYPPPSSALLLPGTGCTHGGNSSFCFPFCTAKRKA